MAMGYVSANLFQSEIHITKSYPYIFLQRVDNLCK